MRNSQSSNPEPDTWATLAQAGEFGAIARWAGLLSPGAGVRLGIGDDGALLGALQAPIVSCDALVEGVHFKLGWASPRDLGWKTLAVSLSDLAAMGARPAAAFLSLAAPPSLEMSWLDEFFAGLNDCSRAFSCPLAGGDTTRSPGPLFLSLCAVGELLAPLQVLGRPLRRDGARVGDAVIVTGTLGDSRAGLRLLQEQEQTPELSPSPSTSERFVLERHLRPTPRLLEIARVVEQAPGAISAALDLSDGLAGDAVHIARASGVTPGVTSGVTLRIEIDSLPISQALSEVSAARGWDASLEASRGGEDYELLLCVRPQQAAQVQALIEACGTRATIIGQVEELGPEPVVLRRGGLQVVGEEAWAHF